MQVAAAEQATAAAMAASPAAAAVVAGGAFGALCGDHISAQGLAAQAGYGGGGAPVVQVINFNIPAYPSRPLPLHPPPPFAPTPRPPTGEDLAALVDWATAGPAGLVGPPMGYPPHHLSSLEDEHGGAQLGDGASPERAGPGRRLSGSGSGLGGIPAARPLAATARYASSAAEGHCGMDLAAGMSPRPQQRPRQVRPQDEAAPSPPQSTSDTQGRHGTVADWGFAASQFPLPPPFPQLPFSPRTMAAMHTRNPYSQVCRHCCGPGILTVVLLAE